MNEEERKTQMKVRREKHALVRVPCAEEDVSHETQPPPKKQRKNKKPFPTFPSQLHLREDLNAEHMPPEAQRSPEPVIVVVEAEKSPEPVIVAVEAQKSPKAVTVRVKSAPQGISESQSNSITEKGQRQKRCHNDVVNFK